MGNGRVYFVITTKIFLDSLESVNNKLKNIGLRSLAAPHGPSNDQKAPKLTK
jgi:hypothetical protein